VEPELRWLTAPLFVAALREKIRNCVTLKTTGHALCATGGTVMEGPLPRIRIVAAGASVLLLLTVTLGSASAQSATADPAGKPLPLLQFAHAKSKAKLRRHRRLAANFAMKKTVRRRIVKRTFTKPHKNIADARPAPVSAPAASPENIWPAANSVAPGVMAGIAPDQAPASVATEAVVETDPNQIIAGGHSVQAVLPNGLTQTDVAADGVKQAAQTTVANAAPPKPAVHAMVVNADADSASTASPIGSASWIAHVLAALGGALAAGAVAWFLIRPAPDHTYG
jgi:hypothetical protein